jgi:hypothetical protein
MSQDRIDQLGRLAHRVGKALIALLLISALYAGILRYSADQLTKDARMAWDERRIKKVPKGGDR